MRCVSRVPRRVRTDRLQTPVGTESKRSPPLATDPSFALAQLLQEILARQFRGGAPPYLTRCRGGPARTPPSSPRTSVRRAGAGGSPCARPARSERDERDPAEGDVKRENGPVRGEHRSLLESDERWVRRGERGSKRWEWRDRCRNGAVRHPGRGTPFRPGDAHLLDLSHRKDGFRSATPGRIDARCAGVRRRAAGREHSGWHLW